jgi:hypothetical protein
MTTASKPIFACRVCGAKYSKTEFPSYCDCNAPAAKPLSAANYSKTSNSSKAAIDADRERARKMLACRHAQECDLCDALAEQFAAVRAEGAAERTREIVSCLLERQRQCPSEVTATTIEDIEREWLR